MNLTTLERLKAYLEGGYEAKLPLLNGLLASVSAKVEKYLDRTALVAAYTETFSIEPGTSFIRLKAYPVTSVTYVSNDVTRVHDSTGYLDSDDYYVDLTRGTIEIDYGLDGGPGALKVSYTGGMAATDEAFAAAYPDIANAVEIQTIHEFRARDSLAPTSFAALGISSSVSSQIALLDEVTRVLDEHRRLTRA